MIYHLEVTCPYCAGPVEHAASGTTTTWHTRTLIHCTLCDAEIIIAVQLVATNDHHQPRTPIEHGTTRGYSQHRHREPGPVKCDPCITAHNLAKQRRRAHRKTVAANTRAVGLAPQTSGDGGASTPRPRGQITYTEVPDDAG